MKEAREYKSKLITAEKEISSLRSHDKENCNFPPTDSSEVQKLRETKEALSNKLLKYATHCQRLEVEKSGIIETVKSCNFSDSSIAGIEEDLGGAVISLVDRLGSLEEECDSLTSEAKRSSSYLMELDRYKSDNSSLEKNMTDAQDRLKKLTNLEGELCSKLNEAQDEILSLRKEQATLQKMAESSRQGAADLDTERSRQLRYLEQENLQLMNELREVRTKLMSLESELITLRSDQTENLTEDLGTILNEQKLVPLGESDKENLLNVSVSESINISSKRKSKLASSVRKSARKRLKSMTPNIKPKRLGLGDGEGETNLDDETGECRQS